MSAALRAFKQILPAIYDNFEAVSHTLPPVTNLAALVEQLAALPTKACLLDADRLGKGTYYVRSGMQNWAFQICYHQLLAGKRRNTFLTASRRKSSWKSGACSAGTTTAGLVDAIVNRIFTDPPRLTRRRTRPRSETRRVLQTSPATRAW
jgi:hypothetical protein